METVNVLDEELSNRVVFAELGINGSLVAFIQSSDNIAHQNLLGKSIRMSLLVMQLILVPEPKFV